MAALMRSPVQFNNDMPPGIASLSVTRRAVPVHVGVDAGDGARRGGSVGRPRTRCARHRRSRAAPDPEGGHRPRQVRRDRAVRVRLAAGVESVPDASARGGGASQFADRAVGRDAADAGAGRGDIAAGVFGFLAVLGLREVVFALVGPTQFRRMSAALQASLVAVLTTALLLLPVHLQGRGGGWLAQGGIDREGSSVLVVRRAARSTGRFGHRQSAAHTARRLSASPRTRCDSALSQPVAALSSTGRHRHRRIRPRYPRHDPGVRVEQPSAADGVWARCFQEWRTEPWMELDRGPRCCEDVPPPGRILLHAADAVATRVASCGHGGVARHWPVARGACPQRGTGRRAFLSRSRSSLASVLSGFRHATRVPAELRAGSTFSLALVGDAAPYISGVKRAGWLAVVVPTLLRSRSVDTAILGAHVALLHVGAGLCLSALLMEMLFLRYRRVPFVSGYVPSADVKLIGVVFLASVLSGSFALAWVERSAFETAMGYVALAHDTAGTQRGREGVRSARPADLLSRSIWMSIQCYRRSA